MKATKKMAAAAATALMSFYGIDANDEGARAAFEDMASENGHVIISMNTNRDRGPFMPAA